MSIAPISYTMFEILGVILLLLCVVFRYKKKDMQIESIIMELAAILFFGMMLELIQVKSGTYTYPPFNLMLFEVPVIIGIGWSVILFSAMWLTDSFKLPEWSRVFVDAFLALLIDLSMDAVAIRDIYKFDSLTSGMWAWGIDFNAEWFGVPWFNFAGWFNVILSMSIALRLMRIIAKKYNKTLVNFIYPIIAFGLALLFLSIFALSTTYIPNLILFICQMTFAIIVIIWKWREAKNPINITTDFPIYIVPFAFHAFFLGLMLIKGYYLDTIPILLMSIITFILHMVFLWRATITSKNSVKEKEN